MTQPLEIEQKFRVDSHRRIEALLAGLGAERLTVEQQCDTYFRHPCRDFGQTGEAFRVREVNGDALVTYKGPRLAGTVKIRRELELPLADGTREGWFEILEQLGFVPVAQVRKHRIPFQLNWQGKTLTIALDDVEKLGKFVEVESVIDDQSQSDEIQAAILALAEHLELREVEVRSYLRQLLEKENPPT